MKRNAAMALLGAALNAFAVAGANATEVTVLTAWYGQSCGAAHGNVTSHVKASCDRKPSCQYPVDVNTLGDSALGCRKNFIVLYTCAGSPEARLAQLPAEASGSSVTLSCVASATRK